MERVTKILEKLLINVMADSVPKSTYASSITIIDDSFSATKFSIHFNDIGMLVGAFGFGKITAEFD
jgi:hypothetical protein